MALGRITGPMLSANLTRLGVDLSIETQLLYVDVTNGRIGIQTSTPSVELDIDGDVKVSQLLEIEGFITIKKFQKMLK